MTSLLRKAFDLAAEELPDDDQDEIARSLIKFMESDEQSWNVAFSRSPDKVRKLADRALRDFRDGLTEPLDPEKL